MNFGQSSKTSSLVLNNIGASPSAQRERSQAGRNVIEPLPRSRKVGIY